MSNSFEKYQQRRLISSYFSVVLSMALVLFLLGVLGLLLINAKKLTNHFKERITLSVFLKENARDVEVSQLQKSLALAPYVLSAKYISKEEAALIHSEDIGEDFINFLGYNPLQDVIDLHIKAAYVTPDQLEEISTDINQREFVSEVLYDRPLITLLNENVKKLSFWILAASGVFLLICILLINSSIRLSIYSKRFIIKTMQMVGATKAFIRKPFLIKSLQWAGLSSLVAVCGLGGVLYYLNQVFPQTELLQQPLWLVVLFISVPLLGFIIGWISTYFATQRFLNLQTEELYY